MAKAGSMLDEKYRRSFSRCLRCPFCGSDDIRIHVHPSWTDGFRDSRMRTVDRMPPGWHMPGRCFTCHVEEGVEYAPEIARRLLGLERVLPEPVLNTLMRAMAELFMMAGDMRMDPWNRTA